MKKQFEKPEFEEKGKIEDKIVEMMDAVKIGDNSTVVFTPESKKLIEEVAAFSRKTGIYKANIERGQEYAKDTTPEQLYLEMIAKVADAPTFLHAICSAHLLIPFIDDKLKGGD